MLEDNKFYEKRKKIEQGKWDYKCWEGGFNANREMWAGFHWEGAIQQTFENS